MDHLPIPESCLENLFEVPHLRLAPGYDNKGFFGFLERCGSSEGQLRKDLENLRCAIDGKQPISDDNTAEIMRLSSLIQELCWFGTLHEFALRCGTPLDLAAFSRLRSDGKYVLDTSTLSAYVGQVAQQRLFAPNDNGKLASICVKAASLLEALIDTLVLQNIPIQVSIAVLLETVEMASIALFGKRIRAVPIRAVIANLFQNMEGGIDATWCPSRRNLLKSSMGTCFSRIVSITLPSHDERRHRCCNVARCVYHPRSPSEIILSHIANCDKLCGDFKVDEQKLISILQQDGCPGFICAGNELLSSPVDVKSRSYVAISHVWSHGLGNPKENVLPQCQVKNLFSLIRTCSDKDTALWIDTLSVPIQPDFKRMAIAGLREVYSKADAVLVVDKHLMKTGPNHIERLFQILASEWMTRLWTLQEGRLAKKVVFRFYEDSVALSDILAQGLDTMIKDENLSMDDQQKRVMRSLKEYFIEEDDLSTRFLHLLRNLQFRRTTVASDEATCLATLLGLDLEGLDLTIADIYRKMASDIPQDIIFVLGDNLVEPGLRWAPSTLMTKKGFGGAVAYRGHLNSQGFLVTKDVIRLGQPLAILRDLPFSTIHIIEHENPAQAIAIVDDYFKPARFGTIENSAIIMQHSADILKTIRYTRGIHVELLGYDQDDSSWTCRFVNRVLVLQGDPAQYWITWYRKDNRKLVNVNGLIKPQLRCRID